MTSSIREISIARGHDPREFTLVAFGGAGPMHAALIAEELGIPRVLIPRHPGNFSALGLLVSDVKHDDSRTRIGPLGAQRETIEAAFAEMEHAALERLATDGFTEPERRIDRALDLRYLGQAFELTVPLEAGGLDLDAIARELRGTTDGNGVPAGTRIGHVHLNVSDLGPAEDFYAGDLGFEVSFRGFPSALFVASGGYHHHIGLNTWAGEGAPAPPTGARGLRRYELMAEDEAELDDIERRLVDAGADAVRGPDGIGVADPSQNGILIRAS
jgi:catechol 2,3-dioxygenase-like lactoylglutathione lyase family enzyme